MAPRAFDHLVWPVGDLAAAAEQCVAAGLLVGRRNRHPWGTENHIVQVPGAFLELIAMADGAVPPAPDDDAFPFAGFLAGQGASRRPSGMIALRSEDADADARTFAAAGTGAKRTLRFSRDGAAPDGAIRTVAFTLAFAEAPGLDVGLFVCQQHYPENFWNPAMQRHPNGVTGVAEVCLGASDPAAVAAVLSRFAGQPKVVRRDGRCSLCLAEGTTLVIEPAASPAAITSVRLRGGDPAVTIPIGAIDLQFGG